MQNMLAKSAVRVVSISVLLLLVAGFSAAVQLRIVPARKAALQTTLNANFPFETPLEVEVVDGNGVRLTTGASSTLVITAVLSDASKCLADPTFNLVGGVGTFGGSVCEPLNTRITIKFTSGLLTSDETAALTVTGDIYISTILKESMNLAAETARWVQVYLNMFNEGILSQNNFQKILPGRTFHLNSYYHHGTHSGAFQALREMKAFEKANPEKRSHTIIGTSDTEVTRLLLPMLTHDNYAVTSVQNDNDPSWSDKNLYPTYNRFSSSLGYDYQALAIFLRDRKWNKVIIIFDEQTVPTAEMSKRFNALGITIEREYQIDNREFPKVEKFWKDEDRLDYIWSDMEKLDTQIILMFAAGNAAISLYGSAMKNDCTSKDNYQWIMVGDGPKFNFPVTNDIGMCHAYGDWLIVRGNENDVMFDTWCHFRFKGTIFLWEHGEYVNGGVSREWILATLEYKNAQPVDTYGGLSFDPDLKRGSTWSPTTVAVSAKSHDCAKYNVAVIKDLIHQRKTITGDRIASGIRAKELPGLSADMIKFDSNGDNIKYALEMSLLYPNWKLKMQRWGSYESWRGVAMSRTGYTDSQWFMEYPPLITSRMGFFKGATETEVEVEVETFEFTKGLWGDEVYEDYRHEIMDLQIPIAKKFRNKRVYNTYEGYYSKVDQNLRAAEWLYWSEAPAMRPKVLIQKEEYVFAQLFCVDGCGGKQTDVNDVTKYENGACIARKTCKCAMDQKGNFLWSGETCATPSCLEGCIHGVCTSPNYCACSTGYSGANCTIPICSNCDHGVGGDCVKPEDCKCREGYYGASCVEKCECGDHGDCNQGAQGDGECTCKSGYMGNTCNTNWHTILAITIGVIVVGSAVLAFVTRCMLRRHRDRSALTNNDWIVKWTDMRRHDEQTGKSSMFLSALSMNQNKSKKAMNTGTWNGIDVHYQRLEKDTLPSSTGVRYEVVAMREIRHINVVAFVGICLDAPNVAILTEIAAKGSLEDLLTNQDIRIPWDFRYPILKGVCQGMQRIHESEMGSHGRLKSSNILIDGRWTPKITGFGLHMVKEGQRNVGAFDPCMKSNPVDEEKANWGSLLWTAPEILLTGCYHLDHVGKGTRESDMYSLAMVMAEICTRDEPFADVMLEKTELIQIIKGQRHDHALKVWNDYIASMNLEAGGFIRPCIKDDQWPKKFEQRKALKTLMDSAWDEDPDQRPIMRDVITEVDRIDPQTTEIMDRLVKMLEKYSTNLEEVVTKRTKQLAREKQKTEDLVSRLLPKTISDDLKLGKRVEPEQFEAVTIFFSDIVGFTNIARASTPIQVVTLLNDMYTSFDSISTNYECYKVETIGDAYMIVSGLPVRNGDKHAGEITTCAMDLICSISTFQIRHMPDTVVQLRVGLHTGQCVAGVVGLKMPRYCLFGDTVQIAEQMESGGGAMRIHVSEDTHAVLERLGGYSMVYRGDTVTKNRGTIKTYWVEGKEGYGQDLPEAPPLNE